MFPVVYSSAFLEHDTGRFHPERPGRLSAIVAALQAAPWSNRLIWKTPTPVETRLQADSSFRDALHRAHPPSYLTALHQLASNGGGRLDPDTPVSPASYDVALLAVSAWLDGVDLALTDQQPTFVLARPPGHHALPIQGMGFCLLANAAIAAYYALGRHGVERVAILDWDVHHGNGTQAIVETSAHIAYCSLHQAPFYPGTGQASERGFHHNVLNLPMPAGSTLADYQTQFETRVIPFLRGFQPDLLIVSAGYDANADDPLAGINLQPSDFGQFTDYVLQITPKVVFGLEGGYDFDSLGKSVVATIARCFTALA